MANIKHIDVGSELSKAEWEAANSHQVTQTIADNDIVTVDGSPADNEYAKFTANGVEGRSYSELRTDINVEDGADVTDATNVAAAGAVMEADTSTASMSFVVDEDDMVSDDDTKVPTQQSVKAYVDANAGTGTLTEVLGWVIQFVPASTGIYYEATNHDVRIRTSVADVGDNILLQGYNWKNDSLLVFH